MIEGEARFPWRNLLIHVLTLQRLIVSHTRCEEKTMPRIAASMVVVATVVCSIGLNIQRYPVVWKMVAVPEQVTQPDESDSDAQADAASDTYGYSQYESPVASINSGSSQDYSSDSYGNNYDSYQNDPSESSSHSYANQDETDAYGGYSGQDNSNSYSDPYSGNSGGSSYSGDSAGSYDAESAHGQSESEDSSEYGDNSHQNDSGAYQDESNSRSDGYATNEESNNTHDYQSPDYEAPNYETPDNRSPDYSSSEYGSSGYQSQQPAYGTADDDSLRDPPGLVDTDSSSMPYGEQSTDGYGSSSPSQYGRKWPAEAQSAEKYGSIVEDTGSVDNFRPKRPLVPINRSEDDRNERQSEYAWNDNSSDNSPGVSSRSDSTFSRPTANGVRRLPRVERQIPIPADAYANRLPESPIPVYPSTGY